MFTRFPFRSSVSSYFRWRWFRTCLACGTCCTFGSARVAIYLLASTGPSFPLCWRRSHSPSPPRWASWPSPAGVRLVPSDNPPLLVRSDRVSLRSDYLLPRLEALGWVLQRTFGDCVRKEFNDGG